MGTEMIDLNAELPDEILKLLGQICVNYGQLEHVLMLAIKRTTGGSLEEKVMMKIARDTGNVPALTKKARDEYAIRFMNQKLEADFEEALTAADDPKRRRHQVVHRLWGMKASGTVNWPEKYPRNVDDLKKLADDLRAAAIKINPLTGVLLDRAVLTEVSATSTL